MCPVPNTDRPASGSQTSGEVRTSQAVTATKQFFKDLIKRADSVSFITIAKHYGVRLDAQNRKVICPFSKHKNGRESTASFLFYPDTNSFWCFGCKTGTGCTDFVSNMENISKVRAAYKILELYSSEANELGDAEPAVNFSEQLEILMDFSECVRNFIQANADNEEAIQYIEKITSIFDRMYEKHSLDNGALRALSLKLKNKVQQYKL